MSELQKITKFIEFYTRIMKIVKTKLCHVRVTKILIFLKIPCQNNANHENLIITKQNFENHEILRIPIQNHETN